MNIKQINEEFKTFLNKQKIKEQKLNESYYDFSWATSAEEIDFYTDTDSYNLININNKCFAIFTDEYTGGERITERVSPWFDTKQEAMSYYDNNLTDDEYDESLKSKKSTKRKLKEYWDDEEDDDDYDYDGIPSEAKMVSDGPGAAAYLMKKKGKYCVYWDIYGGGKQKGGVYDTKAEAIGEIVDDFANFDSWEEIQDCCTIYDDDLEAAVKDAWTKLYEFTILTLKEDGSDDQWGLLDDVENVIMCIARVKDGFYLQTEYAQGEVYKEDEILHAIELELPSEDELIEVQNKPTLKDLKALPLVENPSSIDSFNESLKPKKTNKRKLKETNSGKVKTFNFKIEHSKNEDDIYNITEDCGYEFELQCDGDLRKEIEDFVRNEFCFEFYNYVNITPEIIGYKYDNVTGEGFFTLNVVFGVNESYKRKSLKRKLKESEQNNDKQQLIALARKYGDNITLKDILAKLREVNEKLSDQANKSTNKFIKRVEKIEKGKKQK